MCCMYQRRRPVQCLFCQKGTPAWAEEQHWDYLSFMINKELNQVVPADSSGSLGQYVHLRNHYSRKRLPVEFPPTSYEMMYVSEISIHLFMPLLPFWCLGKAKQSRQNKSTFPAWGKLNGYIQWNICDRRKFWSKSVQNVLRDLKLWCQRGYLVTNGETFLPGIESRSHVTVIWWVLFVGHTRSR